MKNKFWGQVRWVPAWFLMVGMSAGCDQLPPEGQKWVKLAEKELSNAWKILTRQELFDQKELVETKTPEEKSEQGLSEAAKRAKENSELFAEMYQVIFIEPAENRGEFGNWVDTLNQGASLEGVHNGLIRSNEYRAKLEENSQAASIKALMTFSEELSYLEVELDTPTIFDTTGPRPLAQGDASDLGSMKKKSKDENQETTPAPTDDELREKEAARKKLEDSYSNKFVTYSIFDLKKVLADEALKVVDEKNEYKEKLALWYSRWATRLAGKGVDFGVSLRNQADPEFHYKWAVNATDDRIKWEVLNRLHRLMNAANEPPQE